MNNTCRVEYVYRVFVSVICFIRGWINIQVCEVFNKCNFTLIQAYKSGHLGMHLYFIHLFCVFNDCLGEDSVSDVGGYKGTRVEQ